MKFFKSIRVKCINNEGFENDLTVNRIYYCIPYDDNYYQVSDNYGFVNCFLKNRFEVLDI